ncbi:MAG: N-acetylmuramoyl-L-alanine amidase [Candidatus Omnitrophota bacterium]
MKRLFISIVLIVISGCATAPHRNAPIAGGPDDYVSVEDFCKKHNFQYSFDTLDDMIKISSVKDDIRLVLYSTVAYMNGSLIDVKNAPMYSNGKILIPQELEKIVSSKESGVSKPSISISNIVIDPGHGGKDPGAISCRGAKEKDFNLKIAKYLKAELEERGFSVTLTRTYDEYLSLQERVDIAKKRNADLFISIHANSSRSKYMKGAEVYYLSPARLNSEERAVNLAKQGNFGSRQLPVDVETILWDLLLTKNYASSVAFSHSVYFSFKQLGLKVKVPRRAPFYVLRNAYVPSVLVETGYLSNRYEEKYLKKESYQKQIAEAIALAVVSLDKQHKTLAVYHE